VIIMKKQIVIAGDTNYKSHRRDLEVCPHCNYTKISVSDWVQKYGHTLVLEVTQGKYDSTVVISACPKCLLNSWVHVEIKFSHFYYTCFPKKWEEAIKKEGEKRNIEALRLWAKSLCSKCVQLTGGSVDMVTNRSCCTGFGQAVTKCKSYEEMES